MTLPILYSFRRCPYAMRARLAVWRAGITCELREVLLRDKPVSMIDYSSKASVPVLVLTDGTVIDESLEIIDWALAQNDPDGWLRPECGTFADMQTLIAINDGEFKEHLDGYKYSDRYADVDPAFHRRQGERFLAELDRRIVENGKLFGSTLSLADVSIVPFVRQFANVNRDWFDDSNYDGLKIWLSDFLALPLFESMMVKYAKWHEGDAQTIIPAAILDS
jgi:glutathione S-transferase